MIQALLRLKRLWYIILLIAVILLIADITLNNLPTPPQGEVNAFPFSLLPMVITILTVVYSLLGRANPFLLAYSSKPWKRRLRLFGNFLLIALFMMDAIVASTSVLTGKRVFAAIDCLQIILVIVELIVSYRLGRQQRQILEQHQKLDGRVKGFENDSSIELSAKNHSTLNMGEDEDGRVVLEPVIEVVRPEAVDPEVVVYGQQVLFDMHQRQLQLEYQHYLDQQRRGPGGGSSDTDQAGIEIQDLSESGNKMDEEYEEIGKVEDIFQESSYKIEEPANPFSSEPASSSQLHVASAPPIADNIPLVVENQESELTTIERNPQLHVERNPQHIHDTSM